MSVRIVWNRAAADQLLRTVDGPVGRDLELRALAVENAQKRLLSQHGTGRVYTTRFFMRNGKLFAYGTRPPHQASAPGSPPAVDTGRLRDTISHVTRRDRNGLVAHVGSGANPAIPGTKTAAFLELGTRRMAPRPFLRPSLSAAGGTHHAS